jgi:NACalpha-BTF3-like transcription factor
MSSQGYENFDGGYIVDPEDIAMFPSVIDFGTTLNFDTPHGFENMFKLMKIPNPEWLNDDLKSFNQVTYFQKETVDGPESPRLDVKVIMEQMECSREVAEKALQENNDDVLLAIIQISEN